jgi:type I restriction enzyme R subunit
VSSLVRAFGVLANDMEAVGYSPQKAAAIKNEVAHYVAVRDEVKLGAGENVDFKQFEAGMRFLLDTYIQAGASEVVATFENVGLVDLIVKRGIGAIEDLPPGIKKNKDAVAETIINNVRKTIVDENAMNPKYYDSMSSLLDALIEQRRQQAIDYKAFLDGLIALAVKVGKQESDTVYPVWVKNGAQKALVDFGWDDETTPVQLDAAILVEKPHDWVGNSLKEKVVAQAIKKVLPEGFDRFDELFDLVKARDEYR